MKLNIKLILMFMLGVITGALLILSVIGCVIFLVIVLVLYELLKNRHKSNAKMQIMNGGNKKWQI